MNIRRNLIIGHTGNIGRHVGRLLGSDFVGLSKENRDILPSILDSEFNTVFHLAGDIQPGIATRPRQFVESNVLLTAEMLERLRTWKTQRFVFVSSCAVYGSAHDTSENTQPIPNSGNGIAKLLNECLIREFCSAAGIAFTIFRVFNVYGGNDNFSVVSRLIRAARSSEVFSLMNNGESERDFVHVEDVATIISELSTQNIEGETINIGTGISVSIKRLLDIAHEIVPDLVVERHSRTEVHSAKANISLLRRFVPDFRFQSVESFLEESLKY